MLPIPQPIPPNWAIKNADGSRYCNSPNLNGLNIIESIEANNCAAKINLSKVNYGVVYDCDIIEPPNFNRACANAPDINESVPSAGIPNVFTGPVNYPAPSRGLLSNRKTVPAPVPVSVPAPVIISEYFPAPAPVPVSVPAPVPVSAPAPVRRPRNISEQNGIELGTMSIPLLPNKTIYSKALRAELSPANQQKKNVIDYLPSCLTKLNNYKTDRKFFCDKNVPGTCEQYNQVNNFVNNLKGTKNRACLTGTSYLNSDCDNIIDAVGKVCSLPNLANY